MATQAIDRGAALPKPKKQDTVHTCHSSNNGSSYVSGYSYSSSTPPPVVTPPIGTPSNSTPPPNPSNPVTTTGGQTNGANDLDTLLTNPDIYTVLRKILVLLEKDGSNKNLIVGIKQWLKSNPTVGAMPPNLKTTEHLKPATETPILPPGIPPPPPPLPPQPTATRVPEATNQVATKYNVEINKVISEIGKYYSVSTLATNTKAIIEEIYSQIDKAKNTLAKPAVSNFSSDDIIKVYLKCTEEGENKNIRTKNDLFKVINREIHLQDVKKAYCSHDDTPKIISSFSKVFGWIYDNITNDPEKKSLFIYEACKYYHPRKAENTPLNVIMSYYYKELRQRKIDEEQELIKKREENKRRPKEEGKGGKVINRVDNNANSTYASHIHELNAKYGTNTTEEKENPIDYNNDSWFAELK